MNTSRTQGSEKSVAFYIAFDHPLVHAAVSGQPVPDVGDGVVCASIGPESIGMDAKIGFPYRFQDHAETFLNDPIPYRGDA